MNLTIVGILEYLHIISACVDVHGRGEPGVWDLAWPGVEIPHISTSGHRPSVENVTLQQNYKSKL